jgi:hypothetical protein
MGSAPHHGKEEGKLRWRGKGGHSVDAQGAPQQGVIGLDAAHHDKLTGLSEGGDLWSLGPEKIDARHDLGVGKHGSKNLLQFIPLSIDWILRSG